MAEEDALFQKFNLRSLEKELATAVQDEVTRVAVDEMKKKAIRSAGSYDEFKNLVACAQQKPVERGSLLTFTDAKVSRNRAASTRTDSGAGAASVLPSSPLPSSSSSSSLPKTAHEFNRAWAACGSDARAQFKLLSGFPTKRLKRIFSMEVDPVLLASIVSCFQRVLAEGLEPSGTFPTPDGAGASGEVDAKEPDASAGVDGTEVAPAVAVKSPPELAVSVLSVFPSCARFDLAVGLQSREETASLLALLKLLSTVEACAADVPPLAAAYKCTL